MLAHFTKLLKQRILCEELLHCPLVPSHARSNDPIDRRHPMLDWKWFGKHRVPPAPPTVPA
jgi:hypothetical protein